MGLRGFSSQSHHSHGLLCKARSLPSDPVLRANGGALHPYHVDPQADRVVASAPDTGVSEGASPGVSAKTFLAMATNTRSNLMSMPEVVLTVIMRPSILPAARQRATPGRLGL
jgi:hypothetical protein